MTTLDLKLQLARIEEEPDRQLAGMLMFNIMDDFLRDTSERGHLLNLVVLGEQSRLIRGKMRRWNDQLIETA